MPKILTVRTAYTTGAGIQVRQARQRAIRDMSTVGHVSEYMRDQELGARIEPAGNIVLLRKLAHGKDKHTKTYCNRLL